VAVFAGLLAALLWRWAGLQNAVYEGMPGILVGLSVLYLPWWLGWVEEFSLKELPGDQLSRKEPSAHKATSQKSISENSKGSEEASVVS
jgi:hypothetical protein